MAERLWFSQSMEGLFIRGVGDAMTPALRGELLALGLDLTRLKPGYDADLVTRAIRLTAASLYPHKTEAAAQRELGALFLRGYSQTLMGAAMVQFMKLLGPRRSLERMQTNFRTGSNYIQTRFTSVGPGHAEVWFNDVSGIPEFYAGVMERGGALAGTKHIEVEPRPDEGPGCTYVIKWTE